MTTSDEDPKSTLELGDMAPSSLFDFRDVDDRLWLTGLDWLPGEVVSGFSGNKSAPYPSCDLSG